MAYFLGENANCPVYIQRYTSTIDVLQENSVTKVIDFGCAELSFALRLKKVPGIVDVCAVDIDENLLERNCVKLEPLVTDYNDGCRREEPLTYSIYAGSIAEKDERLLNYDAVTCIELIEHLEDKILKQFPSVVFGFLKPKLAIFTTPNSDFNVLFEDFSGFRHWDHKFEWSRQEFKEWCESVLADYPDYTVEFDGVGKPPVGKEDVGCCSQMAIFKLNKLDALNISGEIGLNCPYKLIKTIDYPVKEKVSLDNKIFNLAMYHLCKLSSLQRENCCDTILKVPLSDLLQFTDLSDLCTEEEMLKNILINRGQNVGFDSEERLAVDYRLYESDSESEDTSEDDFSEWRSNRQQCDSQLDEIWD